ncbi:hypothetical protein BH11ACT2_BH11ACT2_10320 [soil metagenome]
MSRVPQVHNTQNGVTAGVWRDGDVIIKGLRHTAPDAPAQWQPSNDPRAWNYWRREAFAYESGLPRRLGLLGPELIDETETGAGVEVTVTAFTGRTASQLTVDDLAELAVQLGSGQGRGHQPDDPWLSRGFLREYSTTRVAGHELFADEHRWRQALVEPYVDDSLRRDLVALHAARDRLLAIAEALPRTVCHLDLFPANVFATDAGIGLIDWSFSGDGAIGEDIGNLIPDSVFDRDLPIAALPELEERVIAGYLAGLRESGWRGSDRLAILGVHASAVKYDWLAPRLLARAGDESHTRYGGAETDGSELFAARWEGLRLITRWANDALADADRLRL